MLNRKRALVALLATTVLAGGGLAVAAQAAVTDHDVRQADFIPALSDTRSAGHWDFLKEGLHVYTDDSTSQAKAAEYFDIGSTFPTSGEAEWFGTDPQPGQQLVFDYDNIDGNGNDYNVLVGEPVYGDNWWLTNGSSADAKAADPSGADDSGNGSAYFGTLQEWKDAMPNARALAGGFSLGSGVKGDGVLRSLQYDDQRYVFTDEAAAPPAQTTKPVTATGSWDNANRIARFDMTSAPQPVNDTGRGTKVHWTIYVAGVKRYDSTNGWGDQTYWRWTFSTAGGSQKVEVKRNGVTYSTRYITTN